MDTTNPVYTLPSGFRPDTARIFGQPAYPGGTDKRLLVQTNGQMQLLGYSSGAQQYLSVSWPTDDAQPSTLPGTPA